MNSLRQLMEYGQSYWLDNLTRSMPDNGELQRRVSEEGLRGVTSNPTTFEQAISIAREYDEQIRAAARDAVAAAVQPGADLHRLAVCSEPRSGGTEELLGRHGISRRAIKQRVLQMVAAPAAHTH